MPVPFEGIFGDSRELRLMQFLLPTRGLEFNISELSRVTGISRQTMIRLVRKFERWGILKIACKHGRANYYALNESSGFVEVFENLNNRIIEQMLGEDMLEQIASYSLDRMKTTASDQKFTPGKYYIPGLAQECSEEGWLHLSKDRSTEDIEETKNGVVRIGLGGGHAAA